MNDSLVQLDNQLSRLQSNLETIKNTESTEKEKIATIEKFSSIPNMLKCYICEGKKGNKI